MSHNTGNSAVDDVLNTYLNKAFVSDLEFDLQHQKFTMKGNGARGPFTLQHRLLHVAANEHKRWPESCIGPNARATA